MKVLGFSSLYQFCSPQALVFIELSFLPREKKIKGKIVQNKKINPAFVLDKTRSAFSILTVSLLQCVSYKASSFQQKVFIE